MHATFFTLGWVAERHPALVRRIVAGGHELASHGYGHGQVDELGEAGFRADIARARKLLEDVGGVAVTGYRAPTFSLNARTPWAFAVLADEGYRYSSSVYPVRHDLYGMPDAPRLPYRPAAGPLWEFPLTTVRLFGRNWPCSGGGWFRLLPYGLFRQGLRRFNAREAAPGVFYTHPWEYDPGQPRVHGAEPVVAVPPLRESLAHRPPAGTPARRLRLGPARPGVRRRAGKCRWLNRTAPPRRRQCPASPSSFSTGTSGR